jgi:succinyl-CoA synthetase beta subunit
MIEEGVSIAKEFYAGIVLDRESGRNVVMCSTEGGMEIEKVAAESPEKILKEQIDPSIGFQTFQARRLGFGLGLKGDSFKHFVSFIEKLVNAYEKLDCSLLEINPMVQTTDNRIIALDAKMNFDDNGLFRHPEISDLRDTDEESPLEVLASKYNLNYIKLDGNVGCMVNGAGLAMATMDLIKLSGGTPANFLDVGGGANPERISNAFRIMLSDKNVKAVLINIFGGIVRCDKVADGIVQAMQSVAVEVPVIVRLDGTNAKEAAETLRNSGLKFKTAMTFEEAAKFVTEVIAN